MIMWTTRLIARMRGFGREIGGASAVEFGFTLPLLLALVFGVIEVGRALQHHHVLVKGVRDAGRYLGRVDLTCPGVGPGTVTNAVNLTAARNLAMTGSIAGGTAVLDYWTDPNSVTIAVDCLDNSPAANLCGAPGDTLPCRAVGEVAIITVSTSLPYQDLGFVGLFGGTPFTFDVSHEEYSIGE